MRSLINIPVFNIVMIIVRLGATCSTGVRNNQPPSRSSSSPTSHRGLFQETRHMYWSTWSLHLSLNPLPVNWPQPVLAHVSDVSVSTQMWSVSRVPRMPPPCPPQPGDQPPSTTICGWCQPQCGLHNQWLHRPHASGAQHVSSLHLHVSGVTTDQHQPECLWWRDDLPGQGGLQPDSRRGHQHGQHNLLLHQGQGQQQAWCQETQVCQTEEQQTF